MIKTITVTGGKNKEGRPEPVQRLDIQSGEILAVVGPTGSGKSRFISDIEQWADGETPSGRYVLIDYLPAAQYAEEQSLHRLVAEVSQNMNFVIDMSVKDFLILHARSRKVDSPEKAAQEAVAYANRLVGEPISSGEKLSVLSGGQSRALMVADVALISDAPVVLIDEIENAGIDRLQALRSLTAQGKVVVVVTHDPVLALMADRRVVMKNGGIMKLLATTSEEKLLLKRLTQMERELSALREKLRLGEQLRENMPHKMENCGSGKETRKLQQSSLEMEGY